MTNLCFGKNKNGIGLYRIFCAAFTLISAILLAIGALGHEVGAKP
jgi:hypothetical protein